MVATVCLSLILSPSFRDSHFVCSFPSSLIIFPSKLHVFAGHLTCALLLRLTNSNLAKAILSSTVFIVRAATSRFGNPFPRINALYSIILCLLWAACLRDQTSPDFSDAQHPSVRPWYLMKSCSEAQDDAQFACGAAQTSFHITVMTVLVYCLRTVLDLTETTAVWRARRVARERVEDRELRIATEQAFRASEGKGCSNRSGDYDDINSVYDYDPNHERQGTSEQRRQDCNTSEAASPVLAFYPADVRFVPC